MNATLPVQLQAEREDQATKRVMAREARKLANWRSVSVDADFVNDFQKR